MNLKYLSSCVVSDSLFERGHFSKYTSLVSDAVTLTPTSTDAEQLEAFADLLGYLQPLYYPMFRDDPDDLVQDFWEWMNHPVPFQEHVSKLKSVPSGVKVWAIRWLQNLNKYKHHDTDLSARLREELNRASGHINLGDYIDEAFNRIFSFTDKELVSFIRKFKELMKVDKGLDYALTPDQIDMFTPLFEKAQYLLAESRSDVRSLSAMHGDCKSIVSARYQRLRDADDEVLLTEPLVDLLGTLFFEVDGSELSSVADSGSEHYHKQLESLYEELESGEFRDALISVGNLLDEIGYYLHELKKSKI